MFCLVYNNLSINCVNLSSVCCVHPEIETSKEIPCKFSIMQPGTSLHFPKNEAKPKLMLRHLKIIESICIFLYFNQSSICSQLWSLSSQEFYEIKSNNTKIFYKCFIAIGCLIKYYMLDTWLLSRRSRYNINKNFVSFFPNDIVVRSRFELWWNFGRPTWSLACEKNSFYMHAIKKVKKGTYIEIQNGFQNMFKFYDSLYGLWVKGLYWCLLWGHLP